MTPLELGSKALTQGNRELHSSLLTLVFASLTCLAEPVDLMTEPMWKEKLYRGQGNSPKEENEIIPPC